MKWDIYKAKSWMLKMGMDHIEDGLFAEGGEMLFEVKWGNGCNTESLFRSTLLRVCNWPSEEIDNAVKEVIG